MNLNELETRMEPLLAKSRPCTTLFRHSLDVVSQMAEYYRLYQPHWPVSDDSICLPRVLAYAALVHDFGKIHIAFQQVLRGEIQRFGNRHEILSLCFLDWLTIPAAERMWIESAVALHHKNLFLLTAANAAFYLSSNFGSADSYAGRLAQGVTPETAKLLHEMLAHADEIFRQAGWEEFPRYELGMYRDVDYVSVMKAGLRRVSGLAREFEAVTDDFGRVKTIPWVLRRGGIHVRGLILLADHLASAKPHSLEMGTQSVAEAWAIIQKSLKFEKLNSFQNRLAQHEGSARLIAPTGSGKTEGALLWSAKQAESGLRGRTFVLLPYQASMNAMQRRLIETFAPEAAHNPELWTKHVAMVHGRSVRTAYEQLLDKEYAPDRAARTARIESDLARLDVSPLRICSPYQILRLLFEPKGVEGLMQSLSEAKLIFDEIHAYTPGVTALTLAATQFVTRQLGARVLFMTATMPAHLAEAIDSVFGELSQISSGPDVIDRPPRHQLQLLDEDVFSSRSINAITKAAQNGSVLIVVNQVKRAIDLYATLKQRNIEVRLLHSRFTNEGRFRIERELQPQTGRVLVATQAVEVSLDVSYDACFSELAPLESLLQRFGRCNRYGNGSGTPATVSVFSKFPDGAGKHLPYKESHLNTTVSVLDRWVKERGGILEEAAIQAMLDSSYPSDLKCQLKQEISSQSQRIRDNFDRGFMPFGAQDQSHYLQLSQQWEELFDGHEVLPEGFKDQAAAEESWLARARYLVPISGRKFSELKRKQQIYWCEDLLCLIVKAPYTDVGLEV